jgi:hypothetical protein
MPHERSSGLGDDGQRIVADVEKAAINVFANDHNFNGQQCRTFKFDQVFEPLSKQSEVYRGLGISKMVKKVVEVSKACNLSFCLGIPCDHICIWINWLRQNFHYGGSWHQ